VRDFLAQVSPTASRGYDTFDVLRIDAGRHAALVEQFRSRRIPTLVVVKDKQAQRAGWPNPAGVET
jgi:thioredoxin-like negative regulator of GroEL